MADNGMKSISLEYNNTCFDLLVDEETYSQLIIDENIKNEYAKTLYESNFLTNKRPRLTDDIGISQLSMVNNVGSSSSSCSRQEVVLGDSDKAKLQINKLSCPSSTYVTNSIFNSLEQTEQESQSQSLLAPADYTTYTGTSSKENDSFKWDTNAIKLLLHIRLNMEKEFCTPSCKKKKLWEKVANHVNEVLGINCVSADLCDSKYRNLLGTYRVNKKKQNSTGETSIRWDFFQIMDEVLSHKASSAPPKHFLGDTIEAESNTSIQTSDEEETVVESDASSSFASPAKKRKIKEVSLKRYLFLKLEKDREKQLEQRERDDIKWEEKKDLKLKEIEAINNLANAIMGSSKNTTE